ncbi:MAG: hypothetical protein JNK79_01145 [Chitinophagaceae bacterium]|nr:hypothetical protein [Chitinophagaceae bacterium]
MKIKQAIQGDSIAKKTLRYGLKVLAWIFGVLLMVWFAAWIYVVTQENDLKERISDAIRVKTRGEVEIEGLSVGFFRTFPFISLQLEKVVIKDSVTAYAHKDFLRASDIYLRISLPGLIRGKARIGKILIRNGEINIASDSIGNSNEYILQTKPKEGRETLTDFPDLEMQNINVTYVRPTRMKDYNAFIRLLKCSAKDKNGVLDLKVNLGMMVKNISFNTRRGSYLKQKKFEGRFNLNYNRKNKDLTFKNITIYLDDHPYIFDGGFNLDNSNGLFMLDIRTESVLYENAAAVLNEPVQRALEPYSVMEPVDLHVRVSGRTVYRYIPFVDVRMNVKNSKVTTPQGVFENCSFKGYYTNQMTKGKERDDANSFILFEQFTGKWENITFKSDTIKISNLIKPFLECDVASEVDMKTLNKLADSRTFSFLGGKTSFDIEFKGPINGDDSVASNINGTINIADASIRYNPRNVLLANCNGDLRFENNDLSVSKLNASVGKTKLLMKGTAANFLSLLNVSPEKLLLKWKISSPQLHLEDFKSLLSSSKSEKIERQKKSSIAQTSSRIDKMFAEGDMYISLESPAMDYKTFRAAGVKMDVVFTPAEIRMERVAFDHAGGTMNVQGAMKNGTGKNPVNLHVIMNNMDIPKLFTAFDNFGQDAVTYENLKGKISADVHYNTSVTNKATLVTEDSEGTIDFELTDGELNNFAPLQEISQKVFKKQDFSNIRFATLKNRLDVKGTAFVINSMDIRSTALNFTVEGVYDYKKGTDMFIRMPLRNLLKSQANTDLSDDGKPARGVSIRLRVKTGDDGKLKISWDPLRLAKKNKKDVLDSAEEKK